MEVCGCLRMFVDVCGCLRMFDVCGSPGYFSVRTFISVVVK